MRSRFILSSWCLVLLLVFPSQAQSPAGTINGIVTDPTGGVVAGAEILVVNDVTHVQYIAKTNSEGIYVVLNIPPGPYLIQVSKVGFKTIIKPDIVVHIQDALAINFALPLGSLSETVTIEGGAPLVNTDGVYGFVGMTDRTMYPIIRPGSIVEIDQDQRKIVPTKWQNEHERPIYFIELRGEYVCSWCEMREGYLSAVPHPNSKCEVRRFSYPRDAEIVGRVIGVTMRLTEAA